MELLCIIFSFLLLHQKDCICESSIQIRIQQYEHKLISTVSHIGTNRVVLFTCSYANGESQTSPHFPKYTQLRDNKDS